MEISNNSHENALLCVEIFEILKAHLQVRNHDDLNISASKNLIKLAMIKSDDLTLFGVREVMEALMLALRVCDFDQETRKVISNNMIALLKMKSKNDPELLTDTINELGLHLQHSNVNLVELSSNILEGAFMIMMENPDALPRYFHHPSKKLRSVLTLALSSCLKTYVQSFQLLDELFQDPKSSLTFTKVVNLFNQVHLTQEASRLLQRDLLNLRKNGFSEDDLSKLKMFLASELDQIGSLKGPQIIKLALVIASKENESQDNSDHQELIELVRETFNIQVKYLNDDGLTWIYHHHDQLLSLSPPETRLFFRKVCDKMLEDNIITPLEEQLMIKFINQGLTISLTKSGEVIFEERCYKLKGKDIQQALEKIAKIIIKQQQDILALKYKDNKPIFVKSFAEGMKEAAADKKEIKSIVDSRFLLKHDSWLLTILNPKNLASEIVLLEHQSAFGDHFLYHLSDQKIMRWYPGEIPPLEDIFGCYVHGEFYRGEIKELRYEDGQKLFESKDKTQTYHIQGELISNQIYFQQELLREGSQDRNQFTGNELEMKLDNKRKVLENYLKSLNLLDLQKEKILKYYEGFVSTFGAIYISSLAIAVGQIAIDDGMDFFSLSNLFRQLCSFAPFDIGGPLCDTFEAIRSHLKTTPIRNQANFVKDIAIDAVECSDLVSQIALNIISKPENRQRIFDAKEEQQAMN